MTKLCPISTIPPHFKCHKGVEYKRRDSVKKYQRPFGWVVFSSLRRVMNFFFLYDLSILQLPFDQLTKLTSFLCLGLSYSNLSTSAVTLSWKNVPLIRQTDHITYIVFGREKEKKDFKQVVLVDIIQNNHLTRSLNIHDYYLTCRER
mgnify:CR=1 FL=1